MSKEMIEEYTREAVRVLEKVRGTCGRGFSLQDVREYIIDHFQEWYRIDEVSKTISRLFPDLVVCMRQDAIENPGKFAYRTTQDEGNSYRHYHVECYTQNDEVPLTLKEIADSVICEVCHFPIQPCPYKFQDTVYILPGYRRESGGTNYLLVEGVEWRACGEDSGQWVITVSTRLQEHPYTPNIIMLTLVKHYEVPTYRTVLSSLQWRDMGATKHKFASECY